MRRPGPMVLACLLWFSTTTAQVEPIRLAIVANGESLLSVADLLRAELSRQSQVTLLERGQIDKALKRTPLKTRLATMLCCSITMLSGAQAESVPPRLAALAPPEPATAKPIPIQANAVTFQFIPWKSGFPEIGPECISELRDELFRHGKLWFQVRFYERDNYPWDYRVYFVCVDMQTGGGQVVLFPPALGTPDPLHSRRGNHKGHFEVTEDSLLVSVQDHLQRYRFRDKQWDSIPIPMTDGATITELDGNVYLVTGESVLELMPDATTVRILASTR